VTHAEARDARYTAAAPKSASWPRRPSGTSFASAAMRTSSAEIDSRMSSVSTGPGAIAFTRMRRRASSSANVAVMWLTAAFDKP
jgi:hypothetical protein